MEHLKNKAQKIRLDSINLSIEYNNGHIASAFSCVEILVALYDQVMRAEDQFILSKGHAVLSFYTMLKDKGFKPTISGHPDIEEEQGIVCTTGSLGHGLGIGVGKAMAKKIKKESGFIYVLLGDGECQEGSVWEALNIIRRYRLNNIVLIVDHNKYQALDTVKSIMDEDNLKGKFESFGLKVLELDGHKFDELIPALNEAKESDLPHILIANTIKGKGISFMEQVSKWHSCMMNNDEHKQALSEIKGKG